MKKIFFLFVFSFLIVHFLNAQNMRRHKVAIFTPLYLDSAFDAMNNFRYEKTGAKFTAAGLDFYYGAQLALDSLEKRNAPLDVFVYDTKGKETINQILLKPELRDVELIIAQSNLSETRILAEAALRKKIPFISATLPNDAGVFNNPYFVILNSTLQTHIEGIYKFLQRYHSNDRIIVFRKNGAQEEQLKNYFDDYGRSNTSGALNIKFVDIGNNFTSQMLATNLDSTKRNICIAGSLDENFGIRLLQNLNSINKTYPVTAIGMPTWSNLNLNRFGDLEIIYTDPFFYNRATSIENELATIYATNMSAKPGDLFFRGYETTFHFAELLLETGKDLSSNLTRKGNNVITQFDIEPVFKNKSTMTLDYFENKHLYFIKSLGGVKNILY